MREIKFRAWNFGASMFVSPREVNYCILFPLDDTLTLKQFKGILEFNQYTGLKDKNGVEIYEGDIIQADNGNSFRIVFFDGCFQVARLQERMKIVMSLMLPCRNKDISVIGNIYENPELLEVEK